MAAPARKISKSKSAKRLALLGAGSRVLRIRLKDKHAPFLCCQSGEVNFVWNFCNETAQKILDREKRFCTGYDLDRLTSGATREGLSLHSQTVQAISAEFCTRRRQFKKAKLRWRVSNRKSSRYSLGWVPFKAGAVSYSNGQLRYQGKAISLWDSYGLADYTLRGGSFSEDSRGRWYINVTVDVKPTKSSGTASVGIDLGLKDLAATSNGDKIEAHTFYRDLEPALAIAQRANKKVRVKAIHAKIANRRKDFLHKLSTRLVKNNGAIFIGDVNASTLAKTGMAKSVLDAGWSTLRTQLQYKGDDAGCWVRVVNEKHSTQTCSHCGARTGPKGREGLKVRSWSCGECGAEHDRDINAAINIRQRGLHEMELEFSAAAEVKARETVVNEGPDTPVSASLGSDCGPPVAGILGL